MKKTFLAILAALPFVACAPPFEVEVETRFSPEAYPAWVWAPDMEARTARAILVTALEWGDPLIALDGLKVVYTDSLVSCGGVESARGCYIPGTSHPQSQDEIRVVLWGPCPEVTALPHEAIHHAGEDDHSDPRWQDLAFWQRLGERLAELVPPEDVACRDTLLSAESFAGRQGWVVP